MRRADGTLIKGLRNDLEALAPCPDATLPLLSDSPSIVIDLTLSAHPALLAGSPAPKSPSKTCTRRLTPEKFFEGEGLLPGDTVIYYLTGLGLPSALGAEERALSVGVSYLAILIRSPSSLIGPLFSPQFPDFYRYLEARITTANLAPGAVSVTLRLSAFDLTRDHLKEFPDRLPDVKISPIRNEDVKSSLNWTTTDISSARKRARVPIPWLTRRSCEYAPEIIDTHSETFCDGLAGIAA